GEMKDTAPADFALDPNTAAHQFHQTTRDGEAQARAPVFPRHRTVGLYERGKNGLLLIGRNADSRVADCKVESTERGARSAGSIPFLARPSALCALALPRHHDFPPFGELDGIAHEVDNHLPQPPWIADNIIRNIRPDSTSQFQIFLVCPQSKRLHGIA